MSLKTAVRSGFLAAMKEFGFVNLTTAPGGGGVAISLPSSRIDYARHIGSGMSASVLMAPVTWLQNNFQEAELEIERKTAGKEGALESHPMLDLIAQPNPFYRGDAMFSATLMSLIFDGNGYWIKKRKASGQTAWWSNVSGQVQELWYVPHWLMEPCYPSWDPSVFISHYRYSVSGQRFDVSPENVIHFRCGIDPRNARKGIARIEPILSEIFVDEEAASWVAALLLNRGVPGLMISPKDGAVMLEKDQRQALEEKFREKFAGANRGQALISSGALQVDEFGFNPQQMDLGDIRNTPEERVCAMLGVAAAVVGFGTGVQQTKVGATLQELSRLSYMTGLIPFQTSMAKDLQQSLLPEFGRTDGLKVRFNYDNVAAMQESADKKFDRVNRAVLSGFLRVDIAQGEAGFPVDPTQALYLRGLNTIEIPAADPSASGKQSLSTGAVKHGTPREQRLAATAPEGAVTTSQRDLLRHLTQDAVTLEKQFEAKLLKFLDSFGQDLEAAARIVLGPKSIIDEHNAMSILDLVNMAEIRKALADLFGGHYFDVAKSTYRAVSSITGLAVDIPDPRAAEILRNGGTRSGLIDLDEQSKVRLMQVLEKTRIAGDGPVVIARQIREMVPAGPWSSPQVRARVIARTETLNAQRQSTLDSFRDSKVVAEVIIFDNRTGYDDPECAALDGKQVSLDEAYGLMDDEHPNGTRAFAPVIA